MTRYITTYWAALAAKNKNICPKMVNLGSMVTLILEQNCQKNHMCWKKIMCDGKCEHFSHLAQDPRSLVT